MKKISLILVIGLVVLVVVGVIYYGIKKQDIEIPEEAEDFSENVSEEIYQESGEIEIHNDCGEIELMYDEDWDTSGKGNYYVTYPSIEGYNPTWVAKIGEEQTTTIGNILYWCGNPYPEPVKLFVKTCGNTHYTECWDGNQWREMWQGARKVFYEEGLLWKKK